jgi:hypothetical protein
VKQWRCTRDVRHHVQVFHSCVLREVDVDRRLVGGAIAMAGLGNNLVQGFSTGRANHWEFLRLRTGFELPSSWSALPCYGADLNRNIIDFMRWPQIGLGAQDLNDIQRPKSFQTNSWK